MTRGRSLDVTLGVARRSLTKAVHSPALALAPVAVALFMFASFAGAMSSLSSTPNFHYYSYPAFIFVFVLFQAAVFGGMFTGIEMAEDFAGGLGDRLMLGAPKRMAILGGYMLYLIVRDLVAIAIVWAVALATGMPVRGHAAELAGLVALAMMLGIATTLWASGVALRLRSIAAGALIFLPTFLLLFLTPGFAPRNQLAGWLHTAASINPLTPEVEAGRNFLAHTHAHVALAFGIAGGLIVVFLAWAIRGMRAAERGPGAPRRQRGPGARRQRGPGARRQRGPGARRQRARATAS